jgi:hypothetical protein
MHMGNLTITSGKWTTYWRKAAILMTGNLYLTNKRRLWSDWLILLLVFRPFVHYFVCSVEGVVNMCLKDCDNMSLKCKFLAILYCYFN